MIEPIVTMVIAALADTFAGVDVEDFELDDRPRSTVDGILVTRCEVDLHAAGDGIAAYVKVHLSHLVFVDLPAPVLEAVAG